MTPEEKNALSNLLVRLDRARMVKMTKLFAANKAGNNLEARRLSSLIKKLQYRVDELRQELAITDQNPAHEVDLVSLLDTEDEDLLQVLRDIRPAKSSHAQAAAAYQAAADLGDSEE